jgi:adenine deaminase
MKVAKRYFGNIWLAKSGFGGTEYLLPALVSEGMKRGLSLNRIAALTSLNPAKRFGLNSKGDIAEGLDADLALGLHALRGHRALREGQGDVPARQARLRERQRPRQARRALPAPPD